MEATKKKLVTLSSAVVIGATALLFFISRQNVRTAKIQVLDSIGQPVTGAVINPYALRPKGSGSGNYGWSEKFHRDFPPRKVETDENGFATIEYPRYVVEKLETRQVTFSVEHPDFPRESPSVEVDETPPRKAGAWERLKAIGFIFLRNLSAGRVHKINLKSGSSLAVRGTLKGEVVQTNLLAVYSEDSTGSSKSWENWREGGVVTRRLPPGSHVVFLYHHGPDGVDYFSEPRQFKAEAGKTNFIELELQPGVMVKGRLGEEVPRPVRKGRVIGKIAFNSENSAVTWTTYAEISDTGAFELGPLPKGELMLVAMCEGFVSASAGTQTQPQIFGLERPRDDVEVKMERTASVEVLVTGPDGKPVHNASVSFWPNVNWKHLYSTILMSDATDSRDELLNPENAGRKESIFTFEGSTGADGISKINNLPAYTRSFAVNHPDLEMPIQSHPGQRETRNASVVLRRGETTFTSVKLQEKSEKKLE